MLLMGGLRGQPVQGTRLGTICNGIQDRMDACFARIPTRRNLASSATIFPVPFFRLHPEYGIWRIR